MVRCTGPVVDELDAVFASDWYSETDDPLLGEIDEDLDIPEETTGILAQVVPSGPGFEQENNLQLFTHLIYNANREIVISSPYFVPDSALLTALKTESQSGVDVRLYVGATNDHWIAGKAQESYYDELVEAGVRIFQYHSPTVLHAKFILVDDEVTVIGSSNMDERSFSINHEVSLFIVDEEFTLRMYALEREDFRSSSVPLDTAAWAERSLLRRYAENVCRLGVAGPSSSGSVDGSETTSGSASSASSTAALIWSSSVTSSSVSSTSPRVSSSSSPCVRSSSFSRPAATAVAAADCTPAATSGALSLTAWATCGAFSLTVSPAFSNCSCTRGSDHSWSTCARSFS
jgi:hypothetical protein